MREEEGKQQQLSEMGEEEWGREEVGWEERELS